MESLCLNEDHLSEDIFRTITADQDDTGSRAAASFWRDHWNSCTGQKTGSFTTDSASLWGTDDLSQHRFFHLIENACANRCLLGTSKGYIGIAGACEPQDLVCILFGADVPFILRRKGSQYILIGEAYIHGIMDGEAVAEFERSGSEPTMFNIC